MRKLLGVSLLAVALTACGGGGGDSGSSSSSGENGNPPVTNAAVKGIYTGNTNQGQNVIGLVDKNNKFWFLYSPPYSAGVTGFMTGNLTVSGDKVKANNGKDFYFGGSTILNTSISGTVESEKTLNGVITYSPSNQVSFNTVYDPTLNNMVSDLETISGNYDGESATLYGIEVANLTISSIGSISGEGESGCSFSGSITPEEGTPYYKIDITFGESPCYLANKSISGIAYYDIQEKTLYSVSENNERSNAVLFFGKKTSLNITAFGDSLTRGAGSTNKPYTSFLSNELKKYGNTSRVYNAGVGGESSVSIAARQGGNPFKITFSNGLIPSVNTTTNITMNFIDGFQPKPLLQGSGEGGSIINGYIPELGIRGYISLEKPKGASLVWDNSMYYTFTRVSDGAEIKFDQPLTFYTNFGEEHRGDIQIIWAGQNGPSNLRSIQDVKAMVQHLNALNKKYLVINKPTSTDAEDEAWAAEFGSRFIPIRKYMLEFGLKEAAITPTEQDMLDISNGKIPTSLRSDATHWNDKGYEVMGKYIFKTLKEFGWV